MFSFLSSLTSILPSFPNPFRLRRALPAASELPLPVFPAEPRDLDAYAGSSWVYVAVSRIAEAGALVPLRVYKRAGEGQVSVENHPFELLLERPNPFLSGFELLEQTLGFLELAGSAYWYLAGDGGAPFEIWPLRPDRISVVPDPDRHIAGYVYEAGGLRIPLAPEEVVHFRRWHPTNDYVGLSPVRAARIAIDGDRAMSHWNRAAFGEELGVPAGIVSIKEFVSDADFERIKREWRASHGSGQRRTAFLRGTGIEWHSIGLSHTDLDFLAGRRAHRDEILSIFGIPVGLVDANATEANATVAERHFVERTLYPKLVRLAQKITRDVLPFWGDGYIARFDDIRPTDTAARLAEIGAARGVLTRDELRARFYDLPPLPKP
ncbi:MAG: phage portal protein [Chloroflexi bacterium]|nr:phage portal protein [Chloroflexota bacterium]